MDGLRRETRPETVNRVIQRVISAHGKPDDEALAIRTYNSEKINKYEIAEWLLSHQTVINNIMSSKMLTHFIAEITSEITSETQRLEMMKTTKSQLETRLQNLQPVQHVDVEHGGSRRRRASKHSKKSRKSQSRRTKTKSRRH